MLDTAKSIEEHCGIYTADYIANQIAQTNIVPLKSKKRVLIGRKCLLKVNMSVGLSEVSDEITELKKIEHACSLRYRPDSIMDLSIVNNKTPLWKRLTEDFDGAIGVIPYYPIFDSSKGISVTSLIEKIIEMAEGGVSFMTLHPTANISTYKKALKSKRLIPTTSRGGYMIMKDQVINSRQDNILVENFSEIMKILKKHNVSLSIGSVFRPATIWDALDDFHKAEIEAQKKFINIAKQQGVPVMMEGVGHISIDQILDYAELIRPLNVPLMPLGPLPSDETIGFDHIANSIGAITMARTGVVGMINSVTREEHTGKVPSFESIVEGLQVAQTVAHCYNISRFNQYKEIMEKTGFIRSVNQTCVCTGGLINASVELSEKNMCSRCKHACPLKKNIY